MHNGRCLRAVPSQTIPKYLLMPLLPLLLLLPHLRSFPFQLHSSFIPSVISAMAAPVQPGHDSPRQLEAGVTDDKRIAVPAIITSQDPFGDERDATVKYKTMTWW